MRDKEYYTSKEYNNINEYKCLPSMEYSKFKTKETYISKRELFNAPERNDFSKNKYKAHKTDTSFLKRLITASSITPAVGAISIGVAIGAPVIMDAINPSLIKMDVVGVGSDFVALDFDLKKIELEGHLVAEISYGDEKREVEIPHSHHHEEELPPLFIRDLKPNQNYQVNVFSYTEDKKENIYKSSFRTTDGKTPDFYYEFYSYNTYENYEDLSCFIYASDYYDIYNSYRIEINSSDNNITLMKDFEGKETYESLGVLASTELTFNIYGSKDNNEKLLDSKKYQIKNDIINPTMSFESINAGNDFINYSITTSNLDSEYEISLVDLRNHNTYTSHDLKNGSFRDLNPESKYQLNVYRKLNDSLYVLQMARVIETLNGENVMFIPKFSEYLDEVNNKTILKYDIYISDPKKLYESYRFIIEGNQDLVYRDENVENSYLKGEVDFLDKDNYIFKIYGVGINEDTLLYKQNYEFNSLAIVPENYEATYNDVDNLLITSMNQDGYLVVDIPMNFVNNTNLEYAYKVSYGDEYRYFYDGDARIYLPEDTYEVTFKYDFVLFLDGIEHVYKHVDGKSYNTISMSPLQIGSDFINLDFDFSRLCDGTYIVEAVNGEFKASQEFINNNLSFKENDTSWFIKDLKPETNYTINVKRKDLNSNELTLIYKDEVTTLNGASPIFYYDVKNTKLTDNNEDLSVYTYISDYNNLYDSYYLEILSNNNKINTKEKIFNNEITKHLGVLPSCELTFNIYGIKDNIEELLNVKKINVLNDITPTEINVSKFEIGNDYINYDISPLTRANYYYFFDLISEDNSLNKEGVSLGQGTINNLSYNTNYQLLIYKRVNNEYNILESASSFKTMDGQTVMFNPSYQTSLNTALNKTDLIYKIYVSDPINLYDSYELNVLNNDQIVHTDTNLINSYFDSKISDLSIGTYKFEIYGIKASSRDLLYNYDYVFESLAVAPSTYEATYNDINNLAINATLDENIIKVDIPLNFTNNTNLKYACKINYNDEYQYIYDGDAIIYVPSNTYEIKFKYDFVLFLDGREILYDSIEGKPYIMADMSLANVGSDFAKLEFDFSLIEKGVYEAEVISNNFKQNKVLDNSDGNFQVSNPTWLIENLKANENYNVNIIRKSDNKSIYKNSFITLDGSTPIFYYEFNNNKLSDGNNELEVYAIISDYNNIYSSYRVEILSNNININENIKNKRINKNLGVLPSGELTFNIYGSKNNQESLLDTHKYNVTNNITLEPISLNRLEVGNDYITYDIDSLNNPSLFYFNLISEDNTNDKLDNKLGVGFIYDLDSNTNYQLLVYKKVSNEYDVLQFAKSFKTLKGDEAMFVTDTSSYLNEALNKTVLKYNIYVSDPLNIYQNYELNILNTNQEIVHTNTNLVNKFFRSDVNDLSVGTYLFAIYGINNSNKTLLYEFEYIFESLAIVPEVFEPTYNDINTLDIKAFEGPTNNIRVEIPLNLSNSTNLKYAIKVLYNNEFTYVYDGDATIYLPSDVTNITFKYQLVLFLDGKEIVYDTLSGVPFKMASMLVDNIGSDFAYLKFDLSLFEKGSYVVKASNINGSQEMNLSNENGEFKANNPDWFIKYLNPSTTYDVTIYKKDLQSNLLKEVFKDSFTTLDGSKPAFHYTFDENPVDLNNKELDFSLYVSDYNRVYDSYRLETISNNNKIHINDIVRDFVVFKDFGIIPGLELTFNVYGSNSNGEVLLSTKKYSSNNTTTQKEFTINKLDVGNDYLDYDISINDDFSNYYFDLIDDKNYNNSFNNQLGKGFISNLTANSSYQLYIYQKYNNSKILHYASEFKTPTGETVMVKKDVSSYLDSLTNSTVLKYNIYISDPLMLYENYELNILNGNEIVHTNNNLVDQRFISDVTDLTVGTYKFNIYGLNGSSKVLVNTFDYVFNSLVNKPDVYEATYNDINTLNIVAEHLSNGKIRFEIPLNFTNPTTSKYAVKVSYGSEFVYVYDGDAIITLPSNATNVTFKYDFVLFIDGVEHKYHSLNGKPVHVPSMIKNEIGSDYANIKFDLSTLSNQNYVIDVTNNTTKQTFDLTYNSGITNDVFVNGLLPNTTYQVILYSKSSTGTLTKLFIDSFKTLDGSNVSFVPKYNSYLDEVNNKTIFTYDIYISDPNHLYQSYELNILSGKEVVHTNTNFADSRFISEVTDLTVGTYTIKVYGINSTNRVELYTEDYAFESLVTKPEVYGATYNDINTLDVTYSLDSNDMLVVNIPLNFKNTTNLDYACKVKYNNDYKYVRDGNLTLSLPSETVNINLSYEFVLFIDGVEHSYNVIEGKPIQTINMIVNNIGSDYADISLDLANLGKGFYKAEVINNSDVKSLELVNNNHEFQADKQNWLIQNLKPNLAYQLNLLKKDDVTGQFKNIFTDTFTTLDGSVPTFLYKFTKTLQSDGNNDLDVFTLVSDYNNIYSSYRMEILSSNNSIKINEKILNKQLFKNLGVLPACDLTFKIYGKNTSGEALLDTRSYNVSNTLSFKTFNYNKLDVGNDYLDYDISLTDDLSMYHFDLFGSDGTEFLTNPLGKGFISNLTPNITYQLYLYSNNGTYDVLQAVKEIKTLDGSNVSFVPKYETYLDEANNNTIFKYNVYVSDPLNNYDTYKFQIYKDLEMLYEDRNLIEKAFVSELDSLKVGTYNLKVVGIKGGVESVLYTTDYNFESLAVLPSVYEATYNDIETLNITSELAPANRILFTVPLNFTNPTTQNYVCKVSYNNEVTYVSDGDALIYLPSDTYEVTFTYEFIIILDGVEHKYHTIVGKPYHVVKMNITGLGADVAQIEFDMSSIDKGNYKLSVYKGGTIELISSSEWNNNDGRFQKYPQKWYYDYLDPSTTYDVEIKKVDSALGNPVIYKNSFTTTDGSKPEFIYSITDTDPNYPENIKKLNVFLKISDKFDFYTAYRFEMTSTSGKIYTNDIVKDKSIIKSFDAVPSDHITMKLFATKDGVEQLVSTREHVIETNLQYEDITINKLETGSDYLSYDITSAKDSSLYTFDLSCPDGTSIYDQPLGKGIIGQLQPNSQYEITIYNNEFYNPDAINWQDVGYQIVEYHNIFKTSSDTTVKAVPLFETVVDPVSNKTLLRYDIYISDPNNINSTYEVDVLANGSFVETNTNIVDKHFKKDMVDAKSTTYIFEVYSGTGSSRVLVNTFEYVFNNPDMPPTM